MRETAHGLRRKLMAWFVVFSMVFSDVAPLLSGNAARAAGEESVLTCALSEHTHTEACYQDVLTCGKEESAPKFKNTFRVHRHSDGCRNAAGELICGYVEGAYYHTHNEYCRNGDGKLVCGLETRKPHVHTDGCYQTDRILVCENTDRGHTHTDACYNDWKELTCGKEEQEGHQHSEGCYREKQVLVCEQSEDPGHTHTDGCYTDRTELTCAEEHEHVEGCYTTTRVLTCEQQERAGHTHSGDCYRTEKELICGQEERTGHHHGEACYTAHHDLICGQEERPAHVHGDECYRETSTLTCDLPSSKHKHTEACFDGNGTCTCGKVEVPVFECSAENWTAGHTHSESCYDRELICEIPEHIHTEACMTRVSQPEPEMEEPESEEPAAEPAEDKEEKTEKTEAWGDAREQEETPETQEEEPEEDPETPEKEPENPEDETEEQEKDPEKREVEPEEPEEEPVNPEEKTENPEKVPENQEEESENPEEKPENPEKETKNQEKEPEEQDEELEDPEEKTENPEAEPKNPEEKTKNPEEDSEDQEEEPEKREEEPEKKEEEPENPEKEPENQEETPENPEEEPEEQEAEAENPEADIPTSITTDENAPIRVSVTCNTDAALPEGTEIIVFDPEAEPVKTAPKMLSPAKSGTRTASTASDRSAAPEFAAADVSLEQWKAGENEPEIRLYHRTVGISLSLRGEEIEPKSPVTVSITLPDLEEGLTVSVIHRTEDGPVALPSSTEGRTVTFVTDGFSLFDFTATAREITSWTSEWLENTLFGRSEDQHVHHGTASIDESSVPEGFSIIDTISSSPNSNLWLMIQRVKDVVLGKRESIDLYAIADGKLAGIVRENVGLSDILRLNLGNYSSFALVRDSGLRRRIEERGHVVLSGLMPKNGTAEAADVTENYGDFAGEQSGGQQEETVGRSSVHTIAAYDITITSDGEAYQPEDEPVAVTIQDEAIATAVANGSVLTLWHVMDDGTAERVEHFTIDGDKVTFDASGFSVYVLTETISTYYQSASGETYKISVEYDSTAKLPRNASLAVSEILPGDADYDTYVAQSIDKLGVKEEAVSLSRVFDIRIVDENGAVREPAAPVKVSIQMAGESLTDYASVDVVHFGGDQIDEMNIDVAGDTVAFTTESFSVYSVTGSVHVRTYHFYTLNEYLEYEEYELQSDTGEKVYGQTVRSGEHPAAPQNPVNPQDEEATFSGWYMGSANTDNPDLGNIPYDFNQVLDLDQDDVVHLYAKFSRYAYVIFHDQYDAESKTFPVAFTRRVDLENGTEADWYVDIHQYSVSYEDPENKEDNKMFFVGWADAPITVPGASLDDYGEPAIEISNDNGRIYVTDTIHLYPIFQAVKWISFYSGPSGSGATYFTDTYYIDGIGPRSLSGQGTMSRNDGNYRFVGWYASNENNPVTMDSKGEVTANTGVQIADENGTLVSGATATGITVKTVAASGEDPAYDYLELTENVTLYALWEKETTASYSIIIRRQKATDRADMTDTEKSYEFAERFVLSGTIGDTITLEDPIYQNYQALDKNAVYNSLHSDGTPITVIEGNTNHSDSGNPYYQYKYNPAASELANQDTIEITSNGGATLILCYDWTQWPTLPSKIDQTYELTFLDSQSENRTIPFIDENGNSHSVQYIEYGIVLRDKIPADPVSEVSADGLTFSGWYTDETCSTRVFFTASEYNNYNGSKVLYTTMPGANMTIYAGWTKNWFLITIDPNFGELYKHVYTDDSKSTYKTENGIPVFDGTGSTWMWKEYGDTFQEYITAKRDYVESDSGSWYYVNHDRSYYGYTDDLWHGTEEDNIKDRRTYYTKDLNEATEFTTFEYDPGVYRYAGWYEVYSDGSESETRYDFSSIVDHNITLRLRWQKTGVFYITYDPGEGTLNNGEESEKLYVELDGESYSDNADVVVTRTATPPDGYEFVGWRIRQDDSGTIYRPGRTFQLHSQYTASVQGKRTVFLDAVYEKVPTATIVYHANGGAFQSGTTVDYGSYPSNSEFDDETLVKSYSAPEGEEATATVSRINNNARFILSKGTWLSMTDASFVGWCENRVFDPENEDHPLLTVNNDEAYRVGTNDGDTDEDKIVHLYAIWEVDVRYHLNKNPGEANFGGNWNKPFTESGITPYTPIESNSTDLYSNFP